MAPEVGVQEHERRIVRPRTTVDDTMDLVPDLQPNGRERDRDGRGRHDGVCNRDVGCQLGAEHDRLTRAEVHRHDVEIALRRPPQFGEAHRGRRGCAGTPHPLLECVCEPSAQPRAAHQTGATEPEDRQRRIAHRREGVGHPGCDLVGGEAAGHEHRRDRPGGGPGCGTELDPRLLAGPERAGVRHALGTAPLEDRLVPDDLVLVRQPRISHAHMRAHLHFARCSRRLGFEPVGERSFEDERCLMMRIDGHQIADSPCPDATEAGPRGPASDRGVRVVERVRRRRPRRA